MGNSLISNPPYNLKWKHPQLASFIPQYVGWHLPPESNANFAFVLSALNLIDDRAVMILPNGVLSTTQKDELKIKHQIMAENVLLAVIGLPGSMFESTSIPTCILVFDKNKETQKVAMIDLTDRCVQEVRDQRGQFGGNSHEGRTYHKTINVIPDDVIAVVVDLIDKKESNDYCSWVSSQQIIDNNCNWSPKRYIERKIEIHHRSFSDMANDYNRIVKQKNAIKIKMNKTAAKRLGYDCLNVDKPDLSESFEVVGEKVVKESYISFTASDGIQISISTKDGIHPLIVNFLNTWKMLIIHLNNEENRILAEFRDALLSELMTGNIDLTKENK